MHLGYGKSLVLGRDPEEVAGYGLVSTLLTAGRSCVKVNPQSCRCVGIELYVIRIIIPRWQDVLTIGTGVVIEKKSALRDLLSKLQWKRSHHLRRRGSE